MPSLANNYHIGPSGVFMVLPPRYVRHDLPPLPEQSRDVTITGNARNINQTATAKQQGAVRMPAGLENPYDTGNPFSRLFDRVDSLGNLQDDWNSYGSAAPNKKARYWARRVLDELVQLNFAPSTVTASSDEGVAIFFRSDDKRASIECMNNGEILSVVSTGSEPPEVRSISQDHIKHEVSTIQTFLMK